MSYKIGFNKVSQLVYLKFIFWIIFFNFFVNCQDKGQNTNNNNFDNDNYTDTNNISDLSDIKKNQKKCIICSAIISNNFSKCKKCRSNFPISIGNINKKEDLNVKNIANLNINDANKLFNLYKNNKVVAKLFNNNKLLIDALKKACTQLTLFDDISNVNPLEYNNKSLPYNKNIDNIKTDKQFQKFFLPTNSFFTYKADTFHGHLNFSSSPSESKLDVGNRIISNDIGDNTSLKSYLLDQATRDNDYLLLLEKAIELGYIDLTTSYSYYNFKNTKTKMLPTEFALDKALDKFDKNKYSRYPSPDSALYLLNYISKNTKSTLTKSKKKLYIQLANKRIDDVKKIYKHLSDIYNTLEKYLLNDSLDIDELTNFENKSFNLVYDDIKNLSRYSFTLPSHFEIYSTLSDEIHNRNPLSTKQANELISIFFQSQNISYIFEDDLPITEADACDKSYKIIKYILMKKYIKQDNFFANNSILPIILRRSQTHYYNNSFCNLTKKVIEMFCKTKYFHTQLVNDFNKKNNESITNFKKYINKLKNILAKYKGVLNILNEIKTE